MSFLRRLLGGERSARVELNVNYFKRIRDDATLDVVGEAHRQAGVQAARPPTGADLPPGLPAPPPGFYKGLLVPEPTNQYDRNAVTGLGHQVRPYFQGVGDTENGAAKTGASAIGPEYGTVYAPMSATKPRPRSTRTSHACSRAHRPARSP
jgi:hypothetical protein